MRLEVEAEETRTWNGPGCARCCGCLERVGLTRKRPLFASGVGEGSGGLGDREAPVHVQCTQSTVAASDFVF